MGRDMRWALAGLLVLGWWPNGAAQAQQQPGTPASQFAPVATPMIDPDSLKTPKAPLRADPEKFKLDKSGKAATELEIPKGIDLGKFQLEFDAKHTTDITKPGLAIDSGETSNLSKVLPGQKKEPVLPDYFGLKLRIPTH